MRDQTWIKDPVPKTRDTPGLALWKTPGERPAVLCLHGISAQHRSFNALASAVETPLAALDLRGRGDSEKPESGYGLAAHAEDLIRTLDHLGLERAILCGHSMGAFVATRFACDHPERVRALVLLDGGWPREEDPEAVSEEDRKALEEGLARAFSRLDRTFASAEEYLDFWFPGQKLRPSDLPPDLADYYLYDLAPVDSGYRPKASRKAAEEDSVAVAAQSLSADELRGVKCPVSLVRAEQGFFPGSEPLIADAVRDVMVDALDVKREVLLPGSTHYTMMWQPHVAGWSQLVENTGWTGE
ncbi:alpha/beta fold hydrolase [Rubrobacter indicoceani]|uniref:alpha/beta fold hydrolase n=1 Tax=Rubrobacter indicoceani TaxID=2051957 RepID=UPI000E5ACE48|nr:alpha/beta hydrolase [Rubrobacter indicoceani]